MNLQKTYLLLALLAVQTAGRAATHTVNTLLDETSPDDNLLSLREAIAAAANGDTIDFSVHGTITLSLSGGELLISRNLRIIGPGANILTVSGNNARVFNISAGITA